MTIDEKDAIYKAGFQAGLKHTDPSPKTLELIAELQKNDLVFNVKMDNFIIESREDRGKILKQITKVNGTVTDIQKWRFQVMGALFAMNIILVPVIITLIVKVF